MSRPPAALVGGVVALALGVAAGFLAAQSQQEPNHLVISIYDPAPGRSFNDALEEMSEIVRIHRATGEYKSVRLFSHNWGPENAFYMVSEPNEWASIPAGFAAQLEAQPGLLDQPDEWEAHSDNILSEIMVN